jgi:tripartite-type tricarboxylate transporter receptor subunit TctC
MVASAAILMAVYIRVPADTVRGFVDAAKARPQVLANYGSAGAGTVFHLTGELFKQLTGLALQHVPYRGGGLTVTACSQARSRSPSRPCSRCSRKSAPARCARAITSARRNADARDPHHRGNRFPQLVADNSYALFASPARRQ